MSLRLHLTGLSSGSPKPKGSGLTGADVQSPFAGEQPISRRQLQPARCARAKFAGATQAPAVRRRRRSALYRRTSTGQVATAQAHQIRHESAGLVDVIWPMPAILSGGAGVKRKTTHWWWRRLPASILATSTQQRDVRACALDVRLLGRTKHEGEVRLSAHRR